ncbi:FtsX-like permease family protein [Paenibacillaceae bacterium]|nr:FtsX-like permease family protein [Paenibacillaceae bacterium]
MNFRQFAFNNVLRRKRTYAAHFMSSAFSVMVFFIYAVLLFHPSLQGQLRASSETASFLGTMGLQISQYFIFIFSFFFILYSAGAFLKARKREFGILMMLGMSDKQRKRLIFVENMIIGLISIGIGIGFGILFTKLFLLITERLLVLEDGLAFIIPLRAVWLTAAAFLLLFLITSLIASRIDRRYQLLELIKSDQKPKEEPKASVLLSLLSVLLLLSGYAIVFYFVLARAYSLPLLAAGIGCVVLGTYFLFTQLSVYVIRWFKKKERLLFKKINLITFTDLAYRMRDNANMFFMVATVTAVALCGIGACMAIGDPRLEEKGNPYAFMYYSISDNPYEQEHLAAIEQKLTEGGFTFMEAPAFFIYPNNSSPVLKLSEFNRLSAALGYEPEELQGPMDAIVSSGTMSRGSNLTSFEREANLGPGLLEDGDAILHVQKRSTKFILREYQDTYIVQDALFDKMKEAEEPGSTIYHFVVDQWHKTIPLAKKLNEDFAKAEERTFYLESLSLEWQKSKQMNGLMLIISVLVGVVFFTFAASFIYFRLYADLERDERQYRMISKIGMSGKELNRIVTRQLVLMFFLPFTVALVHSSVAFFNIQLLVKFPMLVNGLLVYFCFFLMQLLYFFLIRWRYLRNMHLKV